MNISEYDDDQNLPNYKIIIVGKTKAGKTKLLTRYKFGTYSDDGAITVGVDSLIIKTTKGKYSYYDTAGQDKYKAIVTSYYRGSDACVLVYDASSIKSFQEMSYYYNTVKETIPQCLIYVVGCKGDLQREVSEEMVYKFYKGYHHQVTSAKKNQGVQEMFKNLEKELLEKKKVQNKNGKKVQKSVIDSKEKTKTKCCE